jgi:hypothetical protein
MSAVSSSSRPETSPQTATKKAAATNELVARLAWHNPAMPFIHKVSCSADEFVFLWHVAYAWPNSAPLEQLLEQTHLRLAPIRDHIAPRFKNVVECDEPQPDARNISYRLVLPAEQLKSTPLPPLWIYGPVEREYHLMMMAAISKLPISPLAVMFMREILYHCIERKCTLSGVELSSLIHQSRATLWDFARELNRGRRIDEPKKPTKSHAWKRDKKGTPWLTWQKPQPRSVMWELPSDARGFQSVIATSRRATMRTATTK